MARHQALDECRYSCKTGADEEGHRMLGKDRTSWGYVWIIIPMILLAGVLAGQPLFAQTPAATTSISAVTVEAAYELLHAGKNTEALAAFTVLLARNPKDPNALMGAGFAAFRLKDISSAFEFLQKAASIAPEFPDVYYGLALVLERKGDLDGAIEAMKKAVTMAPNRQDFKTDAARIIPVPRPALPTFKRPGELVMNFRISQDKKYQILENGRWKDFFWKGINLGAALPGKYPSQFPGKEVYAEWISAMGECGFNLIRVYTIHPPAFYEALREYNLSHAAPLYLVHGVWAELPPGNDFMNAGWLGDWKAEMRSVIDLLHGRADLSPRPGYASGSYRADVSMWTAGVILGREWEPDNVDFFNRLRPGFLSYEGNFVRCVSDNPMESFLALAMDYFLEYESDTYNMQRPIAFTNWPTLDPLHFNSEATRKEENELRKKLGLPYAAGETVTILEFNNDSISLDMEHFSVGPKNVSGLFASYHAYPYYPDFMNLDASLKSGRDAQGPNYYKAYLDLLVAHHTKNPVVISEFGVPSSRIVAHWQAQGMTHGGLDETSQGNIDARLLSNIKDSGCSGAVLFAWIDEWFKKNWMVIEYEEPLDRKPFWYNFQDAEENYGLLGYFPGKTGPSILIDGKSADWEKVPVYTSEGGVTLKVLVDEGWVHLGIFWPGGDFRSKGFLVGIDTHDPVRGDHKLPFGLGDKSEAGLEFAVLFQGNKAAVFMDKRYGVLFDGLMKPLVSVSNKDGTFIMPMTKSNRERIGRDGTYYPPHTQEIGWLKLGTQDRDSPQFDSLSEWNGGNGFIEARIPWGLINFSDPSSKSIVSTVVGLKQGPEGTPITDGMRFVLAEYSGDAFASKAKKLRVIPASKGGTIPL
jgi:tetratricopeptide (TPR) repeat protein